MYVASVALLKDGVGEAEGGGCEYFKGLYGELVCFAVEGDWLGTIYVVFWGSEEDAVQ